MNYSPFRLTICGNPATCKLAVTHDIHLLIISSRNLLLRAISLGLTFILYRHLALFEMKLIVVFLKFFNKN